MKAIIICGVFSAALCCCATGVLSLEPKIWSEVSKQPDVFPEETTHTLPTTTPVAYTTTPVPYTTTPIPFTSYNNLPYWVNYDKPFEASTQCKYEITDKTILDYRHALYNMSTSLYKRAAELTGAHFVFSPVTIWLTLSALAEGSSGQTHEQLFRFLSLPENVCVRQAFYHLATDREHASNDIVLARKRLFVADSSIHVNKKWEEYVKTYTQLSSVSVPFKTNPSVEIEELKKVFKVHLPHVNLGGNSIILESLDYHGLWTSAFSDAVTQEGPFYNGFGEKIGVVEYMKTVKHASIGVVPNLNIKVIDLPVGVDGRYHMFFAVSLSPKDDYEKSLEKLENSIVIEIAANLKESLVPVEIVIPKMTMTSELDVRQLLEDFGIKSLWTDSYATRNISEPAAIPSAFDQRVTVTIDNGGVRPAIQEFKNFVPSLHYTGPVLGNPGYSRYPTIGEWSTVPAYKPVETSFVANKPFMFGLFDSKTLTSLFSGTFSKVEH